MKKNVRILNLIQCLNLGGMEQSTKLLVEHTRSKGIEWSVQSVTPEGDGGELFRTIGVLVDDNPYQGKFGWKSHRELRAKIKKFSGDLILVTGPTLTGCLAVKSNPCKKILSIRFCHEDNNNKKWQWSLFYKLFGNDYDAILYNSPHTLEEAINIAPHLKNKFHLIENTVFDCGFVSELDKYNARQSLDIPQDAVVIGNAGWLIQRKRFDVFLNVCQRISKLKSKAYFVIAGDGPLRSELEKQSQDLGIADQVTFLGWQKNLNTFYSSLDLLLFNSDSDASPRTVLEAMAYGIPVTSSVLQNGGGANYLISHGDNGYLITNHDISLLQDLCLEILDNKIIYEQFRHSSMETVKNRFTLNSFVDKHINIFSDILEIDFNHSL